MDFDIITTVLTAVTSGGGIAYLMNWQENRKSKRIENEQAEISTYSQMLDAMKKQMEDNMEIQREQMHEITRLRKKLDEANSQVAVLNAYKCILVHCNKRKPPISISGEEKKSDSALGE